jgi:hypothetical protein
MNVIAGILGIGGAVACCATLFVVFLVALVIWYWRHQPKQEVSASAPEPPVQATVEHPTVAATNEPATPVPAEPAPTAPSPSEPAPPSADA